MCEWAHCACASPLCMCQPTVHVPAHCACASPLFILQREILLQHTWTEEKQSQLILFTRLPFCSSLPAVPKGAPIGPWIVCTGCPSVYLGPVLGPNARGTLMGPKSGHVKLLGVPSLYRGTLKGNRLSVCLGPLLGPNARGSLMGPKSGHVQLLGVPSLYRGTLKAGCLSVYLGSLLGPNARGSLMGPKSGHVKLLGVPSVYRGTLKSGCPFVSQGYLSPRATKGTLKVPVFRPLFRNRTFVGEFSYKIWKRPFL